MTAETMEIKRTVDVIIPVYKPDAVFETLLERLGKQSYPIRRIIIMNTEQSFWKMMLTRLSRIWKFTM